MPTGILIILGIAAVCMLSCRRPARRYRNSVRERRDGELRANQEMSRDLQRMQERIENLETLLMDRYPSRSRREEATSTYGGRD